LFGKKTKRWIFLPNHATSVDDDDENAVPDAFEAGAVPRENGGATDPSAFFSSNASSFPFFYQRCAAHSLQLCANDELRMSACQIKADAEAGKAAMSVSECIVETRWNTVYELIVAVLKKNAASDTKLSYELASRLREAVDLLKPFADATNAVQQENATLWQAAHAVQIMRAGFSGPQKIRTLFENRARFVISPTLLLLSYFAPNAVVPTEAQQLLRLFHSRATPS